MRLITTALELAMISCVKAANEQDIFRYHDPSKHKGSVSFATEREKHLEAAISAKSENIKSFRATIDSLIKGGWEYPENNGSISSPAVIALLGGKVEFLKILSKTKSGVAPVLNDITQNTNYRRRNALEKVIDLRNSTKYTPAIKRYDACLRWMVDKYEEMNMNLPQDLSNYYQEYADKQSQPEVMKQLARISKLGLIEEGLEITKLERVNSEPFRELKEAVATDDIDTIVDELRGLPPIQKVTVKNPKGVSFHGTPQQLAIDLLWDILEDEDDFEHAQDFANKYNTVIKDLENIAKRRQSGHYFHDNTVPLERTKSGKHVERLFFLESNPLAPPLTKHQTDDTITNSKRTKVMIDEYIAEKCRKHGIAAAAATKIQLLGPGDDAPPGFI